MQQYVFCISFSPLMETNCMSFMSTWIINSKIVGDSLPKSLVFLGPKIRYLELASVSGQESMGIPCG
jgi:hypothetical protein